MGIAPTGRIVTAPSPALSGTTLVLYPGAGARMPDPPFEALIWPVETLPSVGVNAEQPTVVAVDGDTLTLERADAPVEIVAGMQLAALHPHQVYELGAAITLKTVFADDGPYVLVLRNPSGEVGGFGSATGVEAAGGTVTFSFNSDRGGVWSYRFESAEEIKPDRQIFVKYSPTLE